MQNITALIIAYNARDTIERALNSAFSQVDKVILVDDCSTDGTAGISQSIATGSLKVIRNSENLGTGGSRQIAVENCGSEFLIWLDADDMFLPGRVEHAIEILRAGADYVFDSAELYDGETDTIIKPLIIPEFMQSSHGKYYQFERNYLPSLGWPAVRTSVAKKVGYTTALRGAEDYDHYLRAALSGAQIVTSLDVYYRQYAYSNSVSRDIHKMNENVSLLLNSFDDLQVKDFLKASGLPDTEINWIFCNYLIRQQRFSDVLQEVKNMKLVESKFQKELSGIIPLPYPYDWKIQFCTGVALLHEGHINEAESVFRSLNDTLLTPEGLNNLGVALSRLKKTADTVFEQAIALKGNYMDATMNLQGSGAAHITIAPLRVHTSRDDYEIR